MSTPPHRRRLRNFILDLRFQGKLTLAFVLVCLLLTGLFSALVYQKAREASRVRLSGLLEYDQALEQRLAAEDRALLLELAGGAVLLTLLLTLASIIQTHRIAGPVFVVQRGLEELAQGSRPALRGLRRKDEFHGLVQAFNRVVESSATHREQLVQRLESLARGTSDRKQQEELNSIVEELRRG